MVYLTAFLSFIDKINPFSMEIDKPIAILCAIRNYQILSNFKRKQ